MKNKNSYTGAKCLYTQDSTKNQAREREKDRQLTNEYRDSKPRLGLGPPMKKGKVSPWFPSPGRAFCQWFTNAELYAHKQDCGSYKPWRRRFKTIRALKEHWQDEKKKKAATRS